MVSSVKNDLEQRQGGMLGNCAFEGDFPLLCDRFVLVVRTAIQTDSSLDVHGFSDRDKNVVDLNIL